MDLSTTATLNKKILSVSLSLIQISPALINILQEMLGERGGDCVHCKFESFCFSFQKNITLNFLDSAAHTALYFDQYHPWQFPTLIFCEECTYVRQYSTSCIQSKQGFTTLRIQTHDIMEVEIN